MKDFKKKILNLGFSVQSNGEESQISGKSLFLICLTAILFMMAVTVIVFFVAVKGSEEAQCNWIAVGGRLAGNAGARAVSQDSAAVF